LHSALWAAHGDPVSTVHLALWVYYGARWDTGKWRASDPYPDDYASYPKYPSEWIWQKDADGNEVLVKPKVKTWQLREIRRAGQAFGTCVGKDRSGVWLWVLKKGADGHPLMYSDVREERTKRNLTNKAKREKAERRKTKRYGKR
jgi:hypothetical protein